MPPSSRPSVAKVPAAARSMRRPPSTEPVKLMWSIWPERDQLFGVGMARERGSGTARPAARRACAASAKRSPTSSVCARVLEDHRVAGHQRRDDRVDRGEVRVVPRRDHHHDAQRLARDEAGEARLVGELRAAPATPRRSRSCGARVPRRRASRRRSGPAGPSARRARARSRRSSASSASTNWPTSCHALARPSPRASRAAPPCARRHRRLDLGAARHRPLGITRARRSARRS